MSSMGRIISKTILILIWIKNMLYFLLNKLYNKYFGKMEITAFTIYTCDEKCEMLCTVKYKNKSYDIGVIDDNPTCVFNIKSLTKLFKLCIPYSYTSTLVTTSDNYSTILEYNLKLLRVYHIYNNTIRKGIFGFG